jgi:NACalpha-BTF3-like transcription factor
MTTKADYTTEEWTKLIQAQMYVGTIIVIADPNVTGLIAEGRAMVRAYEEQSVPETAQELVGSLLADMKEKAENKEQLPSNLSQDDAEVMKAQILDEIRGAAGILEAKAGPEEATGFKQWLMATAEAVAQASREGGFLGIGGQRVTDREKAAMAEIAEALGL